MEEISLIGKKRLEFRLASIKEELVHVSEAMSEARKHGDLSENSEYHASAAEFTALSAEKAKIEDILDKSKLKRTYTKTISLGSLLSVRLKNPDGTWVDKGLLLFDENGGTLFDGTVSPNSALGREIEGGTGGEYHVQDLSGVTRTWEIKIEPESRIEEYLELYPPDRKITLNRIFDGLQ